MAKLFTSKTEMAIAKPKPEWFYNFNTHEIEKYGLLNLAGKWAVVESTDRQYYEPSEYKVITEWLDDRKAAIGFLKLLKEQ
jgi:hypothetical protein